MLNNIQLVIHEDKKYKLSRLQPKDFAKEIITKSEENILKNYVYIDSYRVIA